MTKRPADFKPQLGALPRDPDRPLLMMAPVAGLAAPPVEVHNLELIADPDMLGNNEYSCCVVSGTENDRRASRAALGLPLNKLTAAQVVAIYQRYVGTTAKPGPGIDVQRFLEWVLANGWPGSSDKLLVFGGADHTVTPIRQTVAEFHSGIVCSEIDASEAWPSSLWNADNSALRGWHATAAGTYTQLYTMVKSWGYIARMTGSYLSSKVNGFYVTVWDFEWNSASYARQVQIIADVQALTGKTWTGPQPVAPPVPPTPIPPVTTSRTAVNITAISPVRLDTRVGNGLVGKFTAHVPRSVVIAGRGGIPANATIVTGNLTVTGAATKGNATVSADPLAIPTSSTINFVPGVDLANGFTSALRADGTLALVMGDGTTADFIIDISAYFTA
jgi:hypothetical protein